MSDAARNHRTLRRRTAIALSAPARRLPAGSRARKRAETPEWTTERWKHRVEAEARNRLKRDIRHIGAAGR